MKNYDYTPLDIAKYFLGNIEKTKMTFLKLQNMVYLAQCRMIKEHKSSLFQESFEIGAYGPICNSLNFYRTKFAYNDYGINKSIDEDAVIDVLQEVLNNIGEYSGEDLEVIVTTDGPWVEERLKKYNHEITIKNIYEYYSKGKIK